jgi:4-hydroxybenzoate polyprenyltransferase
MAATPSIEDDVPQQRDGSTLTPAYEPPKVHVVPGGESARGGAPRTVAGRARVWLRLLRPTQWLKNTFVLAPLLFSGRALEGAAQLRSLASFALFCALASGIYILNDVVDRTSDRAHPTKRRRPIASGEIAVAPALAVGGMLVLAALVGSWLVAPGVLVVTGAYVVLNGLYTFRLKHIVILDVFVIASFFVLRLLAGTSAIDVHPSLWLLLCGGLLALYLGFAKRRHELQLLGEGSAGHRAVLSQYSMGFLDQLSVVLLSVTIVSYIMYTLSSQTAREVGGERLSYSTVFVLYGVLRYLYLVHKSEGSGGGDTSATLLTDRTLLVDVVLWVAYCGYAIYRPF